jgi:hypothetical protein
MSNQVGLILDTYSLTHPLTCYVSRFHAELRTIQSWFI